MPYEIITDNEVDPGSPITNSLLRRLRDNPYTVVHDIAVDGSIGIKGMPVPGVSDNPFINTIWDNPPWAGCYSTTQGADGPLTLTMASFIAVVPRGAPFACGMLDNPYRLFSFNPNAMYCQVTVFPDGVHDCGVTASMTFSIVYVGGVPTKLRVKCLSGTPRQTIEPGRTPVFSGPLSDPLTPEVDLDFGAGFVLLMKIVDVYESAMYASVVIDQDVASIKLKGTKTHPNASSFDGAVAQTSFVTNVYPLSDLYMVTEIQLIKG
jgi:hypothetical protein